MSLNAEFRRIAASDTNSLRDAILRPGLPPGGSTYPGDDAPDTFHLGAFVGGTIIAVATLCRESQPDQSSTTSWRLRGMAALPEYRGQGLGKQLAQRSIAYAIEQSGTLIWCSARLVTVPFYRALGFTECGSPFLLPQYSDVPYIRMQRPLP
jgi:predicted GNAT family N-acyltransferase